MASDSFPQPAQQPAASRRPASFQRPTPWQRAATWTGHTAPAKSPGSPRDAQQPAREQPTAPPRAASPAPGRTTSTPEWKVFETDWDEPAEPDPWESYPPHRVQQLDLVTGPDDAVALEQRFRPTEDALHPRLTAEMASRALRSVDTDEYDVLEANPSGLERLDSRSADLATCTCDVILFADRAAVLSKLFRILRPGGWLGVSDIVAEDGMPAGQRAQRAQRLGQLWPGGALGRIPTPSYAEYRDRLLAAGFREIEFLRNYQVVDGLHMTTITAIKPIPEDTSPLDISRTPLRQSRPPDLRRRDAAQTGRTHRAQPPRAMSSQVDRCPPLPNDLLPRRQ